MRMSFSEQATTQSSHLAIEPRIMSCRLAPYTRRHENCISSLLKTAANRSGGQILPRKRAIYKFFRFVQAVERDKGPHSRPSLLTE